MSKNNYFWIIITCSVLTACQNLTLLQADNSRRIEIVPNAEAATAIAVAVLSPIYGKNEINDQMPFTAKLDKGIWHVYGSLPKAEYGEVWVGGVAEVAMKKGNGQILYVSHGE